MLIYLMRHGRAEGITSGGDAQRRLTPEGKQSISAVGRGLVGQGISFDIVFCSTLIRARQTAGLVVEQCNPGLQPKEEGVLERGGSIQNVLKLLNPHPTVQHALFVGHQPMMSEWIGELISPGQPADISVGTGTIACVNIPSLPLHGAATLCWLCTSEQLAEGEA